MKILLIILSSLIFANTATFSPPSGWEKADKLPSPDILEGYLGKSSTLFRPSINLAVEEVDLCLKDYAKAVKEIHLENPHLTLRDLGKFPMKAGNGRLIEISSSSPCGEVKMLQALFVKQSKAYILTAATLKKEFSDLQGELLKSLRSFSICESSNNEKNTLDTP